MQPDWSPDGREIVFASDQAQGYFQIYRVDVKTGHQQTLANNDFHAAYPRWSPDGTQVAHHSAVVDVALTGSWQIWQVRTDGTDVNA